ncbi:uncharacterized protein LOC116248669 [Nymphaea colorata]|nr:uncharacterized protein LOC116248669 [Nymphaea colorata]
MQGISFLLPNRSPQSFPFGWNEEEEEMQEERLKIGDKLGSPRMKLIVLFVVLLFFLCSSWPKLGSASDGGRTDGEKHEEGKKHEEEGRSGLRGQEPDVVERAMGIGTLRSHWDVIKSWFHLAILKSPLHRPDMRKEETPGIVTGAGEVVKEAVSKSYETSKHAAEASAKLAGEAVQVTTKKVKRSMPSSPRPDADYDEL